MRIDQVVTLCETGPIREVNEDGVLALERVPVFAVADGAGGAGLGDAAARIALDAVRLSATQLMGEVKKVAADRSSGARLGLGRVLEQAFRRAHADVDREATTRRARRMGTTLAAALISSEHAYIAHVGNSRAYLYRAGQLQRLTEDHTVAQMRYRHGRITLAEAEDSKDRFTLTQILGRGGEIDVDLAEVALADGDVLMLASDGLTRVLDDAHIEKALDADQLQASLDQLSAWVAERGGNDNVAVVLVRVRSEADHAAVQGVAEVLRSVFLFRDLSEAERFVLAPYLEERTVPSGTELLTEGVVGTEFHVVLEGNVRVQRGPSHIVDIGPGGHVGELCLTRQGLRAVTAYTTMPSRLLALSRERFENVLQRRPQLGARLAVALLGAVGDRLADLSDRVARGQAVLDGALDGELKERALARALRGEG